MYVNNCRVVNLQELTAEAREDSESAGIEHEDYKGIVACPLEVIDLQICLACSVERRVILSRDELKKLHHADELILEAYKEDLAVDFVHTIHCNSQQVALIVAAGD